LFIWVWRVDTVEARADIWSSICWLCWVEFSMFVRWSCICCSAMLSAVICVATSCWLISRSMTWSTRVAAVPLACLWKPRVSVVMLSFCAVLKCAVKCGQVLLGSGLSCHLRMSLEKMVNQVMMMLMLINCALVSAAWATSAMLVYALMSVNIFTIGRAWF
jgi:hypothetical protein